MYHDLVLCEAGLFQIVFFTFSPALFPIFDQYKLALIRSPT